jgi:F0F1-type ATP synthase membrane subunit b/b'
MVLFAFAEAGIQLAPDAGWLLVNIVLILVMIWVLNRTFFRPINKIIEERERRSGGSSAAMEILGQVDEKVTGYEKSLREARAEGYHVIEARREEALVARQTQVNAVKDEVTGLIDTEKAAIHQQSETARATLTSDAQATAEHITSTILKNV